MTGYYHNEEEYLESQEAESGEEVESESMIRKILRGFVALFVIVALVYLSGISQSLFYYRTPAAVEQEKIASMIDAEILEIPLAIFIVAGASEIGSKRDVEDVERIVANASRIWEQAGIQLQISYIKSLNSVENNIEKIISSERTPDAVNVFFVKYLGGINGIAFGGTQSVAVADFTTVYDFRVLAHEIGHILGLRHVDDRNLLMYQGANGFELTLEEIEEARRAAIRFTQQ